MCHSLRSIPTRLKSTRETEMDNCNQSQAARNVLNQTSTRENSFRIPRKTKGVQCASFFFFFSFLFHPVPLPGQVVSLPRYRCPSNENRWISRSGSDRGVCVLRVQVTQCRKVEWTSCCNSRRRKLTERGQATSRRKTPCFFRPFSQLSGTFLRILVHHCLFIPTSEFQRPDPCSRHLVLSNDVARLPCAISRRNDICRVSDRRWNLSFPTDSMCLRAVEI